MFFPLKALCTFKIMGMCLIIFHKEHNTSCHSYNGQNTVKCDICDRFLKCPRNAQGIVAAAKPATATEPQAERGGWSDSETADSLTRT